MIETIADAVTLSSFIEIVETSGETFRRVYEILCQVYLALIIAKRDSGFIHCDLHTNNVLVQKLDRRVSIPFPGSGPNGETMYVETDMVARIIDFGWAQSTITTESGENVSTGKYYWTFAVSPGKTSSVTDFTKLLAGVIADSIYFHKKKLGLEFLEPLMGPQKRFTDEKVFTRWYSEGGFSPFIGDVDPAEVFYTALPIVIRNLSSIGVALGVSNKPGPSTVFDCAHREFGNCRSEVASGVYKNGGPSDCV